MTAPTSDAAVAVSDLRVRAGYVPLLGPVGFDVPPGGTLVVMSETGAGKRLTAGAILGTLPAGSGWRGRSRSTNAGSTSGPLKRAPRCGADRSLLSRRSPRVRRARSCGPLPRARDVPPRRADG